MRKRDLFTRKVVMSSCSRHLHLILRRCSSSHESCLFDNHFCDKFTAGVWSTPNKVPQLTIPLNISRYETNTPLPPAGTPGPSDLTDEKLLYRLLKKLDLKYSNRKGQGDFQV